MKQLNGISIVIVTKGRVKLLEGLLASVQIARNNFPGESEVILVDDSNEKDVIDIDKLCEIYMAKRIYHSPSIPEKRTIGAQTAVYDIILYLDSDCIATPNLLNEHFKLYSNERIGGVAGLLEFVGKDTWFWNVVNKSPFVICFSFSKWFNEVPWATMANCSVRKEVFNLIGGFDKKFPIFGGEDVDFGIRLNKQGFILKCNKDAIVYHSKETWIPVNAMIKRLWHYGSADFYLIDKHSDLTIGALPKKPVIAMVLLLFSIIMAYKTLWFLLMLPVWAIIDTLLTALFAICFSKENKTTFLQQIVLQWLIIINEMGFIHRCILKRKPSYVFKDIVTFDPQISNILKNSAFNTWSNLTIFVIVFGIAFALL